MTGDPTRDREATPHDFESLPVDEYAAEAAARADKQAALAEREAEQRERMDAAYEAAKAERLRRPGARWRLLVHEMYGGETVGSHYVEPNPDRRPDDTTYRVHHELPANTEFDELVVGRWLHIEQLDASTWWMNIGGVTVHVTADRDGRATRVMVHGPNDYDAPVEGCRYEEYWTETETADA